MQPVAQKSFANTRWIFSLLVIVLIIAVGLTVSVKAHREPTYGGIPLTKWLNEYVDTFSTASRANEQNEINHAESMEAIRQIGTNGLPWLICMLQKRDGYLKQQLLAFCQKHDILGLRLNRDLDEAAKALQGFKILKSEAAPAVPKLVSILHGRDDRVRNLAALALLYIGPAASNALPDLRGLTNDRDPIIKDIAKQAVENIEQKQTN